LGVDRCWPGKPLTVIAIMANNASNNDTMCDALERLGEGRLKQSLKQIAILDF